MRDLVLIGIGTGNPDHLTFEGAAAMRQADTVLVPRKGPARADLTDLRLDLCRRVRGSIERVVAFDLPRRDESGDYREGVDRWHDAVAAAWAKAVAAARPPPKSVALLVWGDPSLYDSSLRIAARLAPRPRVRVVPGITALQALTAAHAIPLNDIGEPVLVTTGRQLRRGWPGDARAVAVMLDGACAFRDIDPQGVSIWWGAFLGMPDELLVSGALAETAQRILELRAEARARHGWIMDTYLLRRHAGPTGADADGIVAQAPLERHRP